MEETKESDPIVEFEEEEDVQQQLSSSVWIQNRTNVGLIVEISKFAFFRISTSFIQPNLGFDENIKSLKAGEQFVTVKISWTINTFSEENKDLSLKFGTFLFKQDYVHTKGRPIFIVDRNDESGELSVILRYNYYPGIEEGRCPSDGFWSHFVHIDNIRLGDHVYTWNGIIQKHAIVTKKGIEDGKWRVAYFATESEKNCLQEIPIDEFCRPKHLKRAQYGESALAAFVKHGASYKQVPLPAKEVVLNAERMRQLGWGQYNLLCNNSESFAFYCKTGRMWSRQVYDHSNKVATSAGVGMTLGAVGAVLAAEEGCVVTAALVGGATVGVGLAAVVGLLGVGAVALFKKGAAKKTRHLQELLKKFEHAEEQRHQDLIQCLQHRTEHRPLTAPLCRAVDTICAALPEIFSGDLDEPDSRRQSEEEDLSEDRTRGEDTHLSKICQVLRSSLPPKSDADDFMLVLEEVFYRNPNFNFFRERYILWSELDGDETSVNAYLLCSMEVVVKRLCEEHGIEYLSIDKLMNETS